MKTAIVLLTVQTFMLLVFFPLKWSVKAHFCLSRENTVLLFRLFGVKLVHLRLKSENEKLCLEMNGKKMQMMKKSGNSGTAKKALEYFRIEKIMFAGYALAYIGANDAKECAILCALTEIFVKPYLRECTTFADFKNERFDLDMTVKTKLNLFQLAELAIFLKVS